MRIKDIIHKSTSNAYTYSLQLRIKSIYMNQLSKLYKKPERYIN